MNHKKRKFDYKTLSTSEAPGKIPMIFRKDLGSKDQIIHRGIFSPDFEYFYFTVSNKDYSNFTIQSMQSVNNEWSKPKVAFFNSKEDDHGMSYSPDGRSIYFSSTRKVHDADVLDTWHLWKVTKRKGEWGAPEFIDIPNLRDKLVSHPTVTNSGRLYFHVSNLDYSNMNLFYSDQVNGKFTDAKAVFPDQKDRLFHNRCTPFIAPDDQYIIYARIEAQLKLVICYRDREDSWGPPIELNDLINKDGQGNPFVTIDNEYLFYATGNPSGENWNLHWVKMEDIEKDGD